MPEKHEEELPEPAESGPPENESVWVACGPSRIIVVPLIQVSPNDESPPLWASIGRKTDREWAVQVSRHHGEIVGTPDGHVWYRDTSTFGTFVLDGTERQLPTGEWCDVTGFDLCLGASVASRSRTLHLKNRESTSGSLWSFGAPEPTHMRISKNSVDAARQADERTQKIIKEELEPPWEPVPDRVADLDDNVSSGFRVSVQGRSVTLPLNGRPVPFGRDPKLHEHGGLVIDSVDVSRIHGCFRFNPFGGEHRTDGTPIGVVEVYDGNGQGRPSTNRIFRQTGDGPKVAIKPGHFIPVGTEDVVIFADLTAEVGPDNAHPAYARLD